MIHKPWFSENVAKGHPKVAHIVYYMFPLPVSEQGRDSKTQEKTLRILSDASESKHDMQSSAFSEFYVILHFEEVHARQVYVPILLQLFQLLRICRN